MGSAAHRFRSAAPGDAGAILRLMESYYSEDGYPFSANRARELYEQLISSPDLGRIWVAELDGEVAGYLVVTLGFSFEHGGRDAFIDELFIDARFRGYGLGREAMAVAETYCMARGARVLHLEVEQHRTEAANLYRKRGYRDSGRQLMSKRLGHSPR